MNINFSWRMMAIGVLLVVLLVAGKIASNYRDKFYQAEKDLNSTESITKNVLSTVTLFNQISEANQNAKTQDALESQKTQTDIKAAVANDDCANMLVPLGAVKRLHERANSLRSSTSSSIASGTNR
jgi:hypothetical protein